MLRKKPVITNLRIIPLSAKCSLQCLNCTHPYSLSQEAILSEIRALNKTIIPVFSHLTKSTDQRIFKTLRDQNQKFGLFFHGQPANWIQELQPDYIFIPFFATDSVRHDQFVGRSNFHQQISDMEHQFPPAEVIVVYFLNRDHFGDGPDLSILHSSTRAPIWAIPINFFESQDYDREMRDYLRHLNTQTGVHIHPLHLEKNGRYIQHPRQCYLLHCALIKPPWKLILSSTLFYRKLFKKTRNLLR